jgi:hypothetical protein
VGTVRELLGSRVSEQCDFRPIRRDNRIVHASWQGDDHGRLRADERDYGKLLTVIQLVHAEQRTVTGESLGLEFVGELEFARLAPRNGNEAPFVFRRPLIPEAPHAVKDALAIGRYGYGLSIAYRSEVVDRVHRRTLSKCWRGHGNRGHARQRRQIHPQDVGSSSDFWQKLSGSDPWVPL